MNRATSILFSAFLFPAILFVTALGARPCLAQTGFTTGYHPELGRIDPYAARGSVYAVPRTTVFYQPTIQSGGARGYVPNSEPAQGQLRAYPALSVPPGRSGVPGDPAGVVVPRIEPDLAVYTPNRQLVGYRGGYVARRFFANQSGNGLPLVQFGGLSENIAPVDYTLPMYPVFAGYNGTLVPSGPPVAASTNCDVDAPALPGMSGGEIITPGLSR